MKILKYLSILIWRCWFYGWVLFSIIAIFPVLLVVTSSEKFYPIFFKIARAWGKTILWVMGFKVKAIKNQLFEKDKSYMFCPNHTSMIDIMVMLSLTKNPFVFVGKKELARIPVFGFFYKRTCILVDRNNQKSRKAVFDEARRRLKNGLSVCIFPEGLVPSDEQIILSDFKNGAFRLAIEHQIPIVPLTFLDCKKRFSYTFFSGGPGTLRVIIDDFLEAKNLTLNDINSLKQKTFDIIYTNLTSNKFK
ncbi:MAG: lysophospholipid acyltransferase family protein [Lutibacter sp.]